MGYKWKKGFRMLLDSYIKLTHCYFLMYNIKSKSSFEELQKDFYPLITKELNKQKNKNPMILIGARADT
eukprot:UN11951